MNFDAADRAVCAKSSFSYLLTYLVRLLYKYWQVPRAVCEP